MYVGQVYAREVAQAKSAFLNPMQSLCMCCMQVMLSFISYVYVKTCI